MSEKMACVLPAFAYRESGLPDTDESKLRGVLAGNSFCQDMEEPAKEKDRGSSFPELPVCLYLHP